MLNKMRTQLAYHVQAATNSLNWLYKRPWSTMFTVIVIAIALTLPTLFWVFTRGIEQLTTNWQRTGHISLYLKFSSSVSHQDFLARVRATEGVAQASLKSAKQGLEELQRQEGMKDIMRYLPSNPLPAVIDVIPALSVSTPIQLEQLITRLNHYPQVAQAKFDMQWSKRLHAILDFMSKTVHALMVLLAFAIVLIIGNTLHLIIHSRYEEIQVLKLIGATDSFIARPFLYSGLWYSFFGSIFAVLFVNLVMLSLMSAIKQLSTVYQIQYPFLGLSVVQAYLLVLIATFLGWLGAQLSVKRQLALIEP